MARQVRVDEQAREWIVIHHPDTKGQSEVTVEAFEGDEGLKSKGWVEGPLTKGTPVTTDSGVSQPTGGSK